MSTKTASSLAVFGMTLFLLGAALAAADWPQWRGPARDGVASAALPETLPEQPERLWRVEVGEGHSSPVVAGDRVYQFAREGDAEILRALRLDNGEEIWRWAAETPYTRNPAAFFHGKGPRSTPVVAGDRVCVLGVAGRLSCLDRHTGTLRWSEDFTDRFDRAHPDFGASMSPAVVDGRVIAHVGGIERGVLAAFDLGTGDEIWSWSGDAPAYASPVVATLEDTRQIVTQSRSHVVSLDAATGAELWRMDFTTAYDQNSVTPLVLGDVVILSGLENAVFALGPERDPRGHWLLRKRWSNDAVPMYMSSPVVHEGLLLGLTDRRKGQIFGLDAASGELLWSTEGREGDNAALVLAGNRLLVQTTGGEIQIGPASRAGWRPERRWQLADSPTWAHPALVDGVLLVKDKTGLSAWSLR